MNVLLTGVTEGGTIAVHLPDATWATVAGAANSLQEAATKPIDWRVWQVDARNARDGLIEVGLGDSPARLPEPVG